MFRTLLKKCRDMYPISRDRRTCLPDFPEDRTVRRRITFSGRVQNVGFRFECCQLARELGLTGWVENLDSGDVLGEFQGPENRILHLISCMESLQRIVIKTTTLEECPLKPGETGFRYR